ncbi:hypothetical protein J1N35_035074 [Gossypium stocksii]|uniref:Protein BIG GRAIN 1-like B n=1 Tax=Gossypium stocksii TaxID=47602 RepID=A0A9D3ZQL6_9ROSI|nr:hypothetical protein J1N35_035074 [Gossypium stocksii]
MYRRESSVIDTTVPQRRRTPSFSSTLLDAIYRSIDESNEPTLCHYRETKTTKKQRSGSSLRRAIMIEDWVDKQSNQDSASHFNSTSTSSESSNGAIFSSSEAESSYKQKSRRSKPDKKDNQEKAKSEGGGGGFNKTKLKALKIYGELKKVKQPISPGGRITNFINSIFNANAKKVKMCSNGVSEDVNFLRKSKSSASSPTSFSRSCLSKTPSSRGNNNNKYSNGNKRSVKFCPVTVILNEDSSPCGHKNIYSDDPRLMSTSTVQKTVKESAGSTSKASDYLRSYQRRGIGKLDLRGFIEDYDDEEDDDDDDGLSCSSSDLFELDHLIGIGRYREELPVYETTRLKTNQAIVNGFLV